MHETTTTRPFQRKRLGRSLAVVISVVGLLAAGLFSASTASAATEQQNFTLSGSFTIGAQTITLPAGSGFTALVDTTTGAVTGGTVSIPQISTEPIPTVIVLITVSDAAPATGTLDLVTGELTLDAHYQVVFTIAALSATCTITPINAQPSTANGGGSDLTGSPATATLTHAEFLVPAIVGTGVAGACPDTSAALLNGASPGLGLPTSATSMTLTITQTDTPVTTSTTQAPAVTTTTAKAAAAGATDADPNFTG